jgi:hypothetical protein
MPTDDEYRQWQRDLDTARALRDAGTAARRGRGRAAYLWASLAGVVLAVFLLAAIYAWTRPP